MCSCVPSVGIAKHDGIKIAANEKRKLDIQLQPGPTFRPLVLDSQTNQPVKGIRLSYWMKPGIEGSSGDDGLITIENMPPGEFEFSVSATAQGLRSGRRLRAVVECGRRS